jgi:hypothetical protein
MLLRGLARAILPLGLTAAICLYLADASLLAWGGSFLAFLSGIAFVLGILE